MGIDDGVEAEKGSVAHGEGGGWGRAGVGREKQGHVSYTPFVLL